MINLDGLARIRKRNKMDAKRRSRLLSKIQKANAMAQREEIERAYSWNGKFRNTQKARANRRTA